MKNRASITPTITLKKWDKKHMSVKQRIMPYRMYIIVVCISFTLGWVLSKL